MLTARTPLTVRTDDSLEVTVPADTNAGAEGRYEDYIYLEMLEREWKRPVAGAARVRAFDPARQPSDRT